VAVGTSVCKRASDDWRLPSGLGSEKVDAGFWHST
jgi:hypothetical protein